METEGMTDKQYNAFLRLLIGRVEDIRDAKTAGEKDAKKQKLLDELQRDLED